MRGSWNAFLEWFAHTCDTCPVKCPIDNFTLGSAARWWHFFPQQRGDGHLGVHSTSPFGGCLQPSGRCEGAAPRCFASSIRPRGLGYDQGHSTAMCSCEQRVRRFVLKDLIHNMLPQLFFGMTSVSGSANSGNSASRR